MTKTQIIIWDFIGKMTFKKDIPKDAFLDFVNEINKNEINITKDLSQSFNVSLVKDCQDLLDKLIVNLDGLSFYDAKYIAGRLVNEVDKRSMVSVSHSC